MRNIALRLRYDGTAYHGWQVQKTDVSVCQTLEEALSKMCGHQVKAVGCGRTDAGVHALRYCANFHTDCRIPADRIPLAANTLLPMNAANILKPALSRGEIQVIGATTFAEYRKHIEKDTALERRFQPVTVAEPSIADSIEIVKGIRHYYEDYHQVTISDEMCAAAVTMSERYITDRFLPDKAIDLIDEACSDVNLKNKELARQEDVEKEIADLAKEQDLLMQDTEREHYERLAEIRSSTIKLNGELDTLKAAGRPALTKDNLARIIELWTKIPAASIQEDEFERLASLGDRLREHIVGQDQAIDAVCAAIRRSRIGLQAKRKPVSFIFVGGTGVGKTELVKRLAADLFDSPESLIRLDMAAELLKKNGVTVYGESNIDELL